MFVGMPGCGKTTKLIELARKAKEKEKDSNLELYKQSLSKLERKVFEGTLSQYIYTFDSYFPDIVAMNIT